MCNAYHKTYDGGRWERENVELLLTHFPCIDVVVNEFSFFIHIFGAFVLACVRAFECGVQCTLYMRFSHIIHQTKSVWCVH